jgi:hypothetical protein
MPGKYTPRLPSFLRDCAQCGAPFKVLPSHERKAPVKFCSRACFHAFESQGHEARVCEQCGATFSRPLRPSDQVNARRFCTLACYRRRLKGEDWRVRFWTKVEKSEGCWLWIGGTRRGYGDFVIDWDANTHRAAHRASWEIANGPIPDGLLVLHNCPDGDNPLCVRPDHLFLGTQADNMRDMVGKNRSARATISVATVREIRQRHEAEGIGPSQLAAEYGMTRSGIRHLLSRRSWKHV